MPRFITGDELGNVKILRYAADSEPKTSLTTAVTSSSPNAIQVLAIASSSKTIATSHADGLIRAYSLADDDTTGILAEWKEERLSRKTDQTFIGLGISGRGVYSCTSNGALRFSQFPSNDEDSSSSNPAQTAALPTRLCDWKTSPDHQNFCYGGAEVELSVWNTESAFCTAKTPQELAASKAASKKRKRNNELFEGEIWRAKNVPNDSLQLRQPVRISTLSYVTPPSGSNVLIAGTDFGQIRMYDIRAPGRRPVSELPKLTQGNGIKVVQSGLREHEAFVADVVNGLYAVDLRCGKVLYKYKGLAGAVTSVAPTTTVLASVSLDRLSRVHSTVPPPEEPSNNGSGIKGEVLDKVYMKSVPTTIVWDGEDGDNGKSLVMGDDDDVWEGMQNIGEESDDEVEEGKKRQKHRS